MLDNVSVRTFLWLFGLAVIAVLTWALWPDWVERRAGERRDGVSQENGGGEPVGRETTEDNDTPSPGGEPVPSSETKENAGAGASKIRIVVVFEDGAPAEGAQVRLTPGQNIKRPLVHEGERRTNRAGMVEIEPPAQRSWVLVRRGPSAAMPIAVQHPGEYLAVLSESCVLAGRVLLPGGAPAAGATISLNGFDGWEYRWLAVTADADGRFESPPVPRRWFDTLYVWVQHPPAPRMLFTFREGQATREPVFLQLSSQPVTGVVVDASGAAVPRQRVDHADGFVTTDARGAFRIEFARRAGQVLRVGSTLRTVGQDDDKIELVVQAGKTLRGQLLSHSGQPLPHVEISCFVAGSKTMLQHEATGADGAFLLADVPNGPLELWFELQESADVPTIPYIVEVVAGEPKTIRLPQPIDVTLRLRRQDGRAPQEIHSGQIRIARSERVIQRNVHGTPSEFTLRVWEPGRYRFLLTSPRHLPARAEQNVTRSGPNVLDVPLTRRPHLR